jgi:hypothetical protein
MYIWGRTKRVFNAGAFPHLFFLIDKSVRHHANFPAQTMILPLRVTITFRNNLSSNRSQAPEVQTVYMHASSFDL